MTLRIVVGFTLLGVCAALGDSWPGFRGATGDGLSLERGLPTSWSDTEGIAWSLDLPGRGNSSACVTSDRVYVSAQTEDSALWALSIDKAEGRVVWKRKIGAGELKATGAANLYSSRHNAATPTAVADESHVWFLFGTGHFICFDKEGNDVWQHHLANEYGAYDIAFGMGSSPRLWGNSIYVAQMHKGPSYVAAFDKKTGRLQWKTKRRLPAEDDGLDGYSTPSIHRTNLRTELLVAGSDHIDAYDLKSGEQLWLSSGFKIRSPFGRIIASTATGDGIIVACSGNPGGGIGHVIGLRAGGRGDITKSHRVWSFSRYTPDASTPVCYGGNVYLIRQNGVGLCLELQTGKTLWNERLGRGEYFASSVAGDNKVYFLSTDGQCTVLEAGDDLNIIAKNQLEGIFYATPAISDGRLYLRSHHRLVAIGG